MATVPKIERLGPIELCVKWYDNAPVLFVKVMLYSVYVYGGGLSVVGDCQCSYNIFSHLGGKEQGG